MDKVAWFVLCLTVLCMASPAAVRAEDKKTAKIDVTGTWNAETDLSGNPGTPVFKLKQDGDKIKGKYIGYFGEQDLTGKLEGDKIEFEFSTDQGKAVYTGTVDKGTMKGKVKYGDALAGTWTAKREIDVTGIWKAAVDVGGQTGEPVFTLKQSGGKITGKYKGSFGEHDLTGKLKEVKIEFEFSTDQGKIVYTGTVDGDAMKGTTKYGDLTGTWTARRGADKN